MRYAYAYKTSDGARHEATIEAESREAVFSTLRAKGIKAIKVVAADGSKANGEIRGVRKRVVSLVAFLAAVLAGVLVWHFTPDGRPVIVTAQGSSEARVASPLPRQQIPGNHKRVESFPTNLFSTAAEAFLARFAEPGRPFTAPEAIWPSKKQFEEAFDAPIFIADNEFSEYIALKRIVVGIKNELREYLAADGYVSGYINELIKRQNQEIAYRQEADQRLKDMLKIQPTSRDMTIPKERQRQAYDYFLRANASLDSMGIEPLPLPRILVQYQRSVGIESE